MFTVYALKSNKYNWIYIGLTKDIENRLSRHNNKRERATKHYAPFKLIYTKSFESRAQARDYEKFLKIRSNKEKLIKSLSND